MAELAELKSQLELARADLAATQSAYDQTVANEALRPGRFGETPQANIHHMAVMVRLKEQAVRDLEAAISNAAN